MAGKIKTRASTKPHTKRNKSKESIVGHKHANAAGFQMRIRGNQHKNMDVYDFDDDVKGKHRRNHVSTDLTKEEKRELGGDQDDWEPDEIEGVRRQLQSGEDGVVLSGDDEDIDSDEAFDATDEETFGAFKLKPKKVRNGRNWRRKTTQSDEESGEVASSNPGTDEEEEMEGMVDLSTMLDGQARNDEESAKESEDEDEPTPTGNRGGSDEEQLVPSDEEDEGEQSAAVNALGDFINGLETTSVSKKRKADELGPSAEEMPPRKRRVLQERTEGAAEGEFASTTMDGPKLQLADLLAPLQDEVPSSSLLSLTNAIKPLKGAKGAPLPVPLPTRVQDRINREAAYETTKTEVEKWAPTMKRIREAEHLSFPQQAPTAPKTSTAELASKFKPTTELETAVNKLLKAAELREQDIAKTEELKMQDLTPEEAAQRRAELCQMRDLMFRAEIKAKRVAKIKSKTFRRLRRKEEAKLAERLGAATGDEPDELDEEVRMKAEVDRARERATLKHKNMGKWAQAMRHRHTEGELDDDRRLQVMEMHERGEKLRRRIVGGVSGSESESDDSDEDGDEDDIKAKAIDRLRELNGVEDAGTEELNGKKEKGGVMQMKFMQEGLAREAAQARAQVDSLQEELQKLDQVQVPADGSDEDGLGPLVTVQRTGGRVTFKPGQSSGARLVSNASDASTLKSSPVLTLRESSITPSIAHASAEVSNPWLSADNTAGKVSKKKNAVVVGKNSDTATLSKNALKKRQRKAADAQQEAKEDAVVDIDVGKVLRLENAPAPPALKKRPEPNGRSVTVTSGAKVAGGFQDEEEDEEREEQEAKLVARGKGKGKKGVTTFEQRELVAIAFAGDNVIAEFEEEKRKELEQDAPRSVDTTLPGWGSWGGAGVTKPQPKPERIKHFPGIDPSKRKDAGKSHVIISEKKDKKAEKYRVKDLPFPYTSKGQFERRMEVPLGMEWNTRKGFQRGTLPRVTKKLGTIIDPLEKLF